MAETWLVGPVTTSAIGWRLERRDGITLGFTSHDHDIEIDGLLYRASPGLVPTSIVQSAGIEANGLDIKGALTASSIREEDLRAGKWDGASIDIFLFDWTDPAAAKRILASGNMGSVEFSTDRFSVDIEGLAARLSRPVAPFTSPTCRARFCDARCGLSGEVYRRRAIATILDEGEIQLSGVPTADLSKFANGELRWFSGDNCGIRQTILAARPSGLLLDRSPPFDQSGPVPVEIIEGCDKLLATCSSRFGNVRNFRGEPHLPGNDLLTRYPGA